MPAPMTARAWACPIRARSRATAIAVASDLEKLLKAAHEDGPFVLVGHSMAGLRIQLFANRNPDKVAGLVFVDAATPEVTDTPSGQASSNTFARASRLAGFGASLGLFTPLAGTWLGDKYGLPPAASAEKRRAFAIPPHNRTAAPGSGRVAGGLRPGQGRPARSIPPGRWP